MQPKSTANLMEELLQTRRLEDYLETNDIHLLDVTLSEELEKLLENTGLRSGRAHV